MLAAGVLWEIPAVRERFVRSPEMQGWEREENRVLQARQDVERARQDVASLLDELDRASERVVDLLGGYAELAREAQALTETEAIREPAVQPKVKPVIKSPVRSVDKPLAKQASKPKAGSDAKPAVNPADEAKVVSLNAAGQQSQLKPQARGKKKQTESKYQAVYDLADQGLTVNEIAHEAKLGKGEVELLLELKNRGGNT